MSTTEIATTEQHSTASLSDRMTYAKALAAASLLPSAYQNRPADVLVAIETGDQLGIGTMAAIQSIHVIDGKPTFGASLMSALVRRAGHRLRVTGDDTHAVAEIVRSDDAEFTFRSEWTMDRARQAGLLGKGNWKKFPASMLKARAISEVCRDACPDVFLGPVYVPEELGAEVDADGDPIGQPQPQSQQPQKAQQATVAVVDDETVQDAEIVDDSNAATGEATGNDMADWEAAIQHALEFPHAAHRREAFVELYSKAKAAYDQGACPESVVNRIIDLGAEAKQDMAETEQADAAA